jgi:hypothetical protein
MRTLVGDNELLWELRAKLKWKELFKLEKPHLSFSWKLLYRTKAVRYPTP